MQLKAKDIGEDGVDVDLAVTPAWMAQQLPDLGAQPIEPGLRFKGRVERSGQDFLVRGRLHGGLVTPCGRCLEDAILPLDVEVSVLFVEREDEPKGKGKGKGKEITDDELDDESLEAPDVMTFSDGIIDLGEEIREELLLALPTAVLCQEDCKGLCPVCGENRNVTACDCEQKQQQAQGKFAALAKLKS